MSSPTVSKTIEPAITKEPKTGIKKLLSNKTFIIVLSIVVLIAIALIIMFATGVFKKEYRYYY
jgi:hypothetical protein